MLDDQAPSAPSSDDVDADPTFRDIHPLTSPRVAAAGRPRPESWDAASHRSSALSEEQFMTMSREFTAMVAAGAAASTQNDGNAAAAELARIGEDELEETNPLAIVPETNPVASPRRPATAAGTEVGSSSARSSLVVAADEVSVRQVKREEVETKVEAWQTAEIAKINNRFKRDEVVINGWESEQVEKATAWLKKIQRKLDEQRAKAIEKTENDVAKARRKAEEKRASAEAKKGLKLAKVLELANFMKAVGRVPTKRSFF